MDSVIKPLAQKIAFECEEAGATKWDIAKIIKELNEIETQSERKLKEKAIEMLKELNPKAAENYSSFDKMIVFTSRQKIEGFDRGNITKSLLKETKIKRPLAEKISTEVEEKIKDLKISNITTSLIREMVCVKLLELGMEDIHNQYTRLGLPVFETKDKKEAGKQVLTEFNLISKIPVKAKELHFNSSIHIPFIEDFSAKGYSWNIELKEKQESYENIVVELLKEVKEKQEFFSSSVCLNYLNFSLASAIEKKSKKKISEIIEFFFNASFLVKKRFCVTLALFTPDESNYKANKKNLWVFANTFTKKFNENKKELNFDLILCLDNKFQLKLLEKKVFESEIHFLSMKNNSLKAQQKGLYIKGKGIVSFTEINAEKFFIESKGDTKKLMESIQQTINAVNELNSVKEKETRLPEEFQKLKKCISLHGVDSGSLIFSEGIELEAKNIARRTREKIRKEAENGVVLRSFGSEEAKKKFSESNQNFKAERKEKKLKTTSYALASTKKELEELIEKNYEYVLFKPI
ncbi:hypothetical protein KKB11_04135 [Candidatus Micrarchaeota archaeon]|nr:hypothetical protein [Candidatus Micrarchaeota archaeon]